MTRSSRYPTPDVDADGEPVTGDTNYVIHFDAGQLPSVAAFWSITIRPRHASVRAQPSRSGRHLEPTPGSEDRTKEARLHEESATYAGRCWCAARQCE